MAIVSHVTTRRASKYALEIEEGTHLNLPITITGVDPAGFTVQMMVKEYADSDTALLELSTTNGKILTDNQKITLLFVPADTADKDWAYGFYDIIMTDLSGVKTRILEGDFFISEGVTQ